MTRPRVLLADDHALLLGALETLLQNECDIVGKGSDGRELVAEALRLKRQAEKNPGEEPKD